MLHDLVASLRRLLGLGFHGTTLVWLCGLPLGLAVMEGIGMTGLFPVLVFIESGASGLRERGDPLTRFVVGEFDRLGLEVTFASLLVIALVPILLRQALLYARAVQIARYSEGFQAGLRHRIAAAFLAADLAFFHRHNYGELSAAAFAEVARCGSLVGAVSDYVTAAALTLIYLAIVFYVSLELAALTVPVVVAAAMAYWRQVRVAARVGDAVSTAYFRMNVLLNETFHAIRLVKMRGREVAATEALDREFRGLAAANARLVAISSGVSLTVQPIMLAGLFAILYWAVEYRGLGLSDIGLFILMLTRIAPQINTLNTSRVTVANTAPSFARLERLMAEAKSATAIRGGARPFPGLNCEARFEDVTFTYDRAHRAMPALTGITFAVRRGETVALVGRSGAGKSTTVDLLPRFFEPDAGRISIDGVPIEDFVLSDLRRAIAFVTQDTVLFDDTIRANIGYGLGRPLDDALLWRALEQAHAADFVRALERGVDTAVGERGVRLSGGQRQRLALARALAQEPSILILDEPTSALDSESEAAIQVALEALRGSLTVIVIAHRLATIRSADRIVVVQDGRTIAEGTHETLLKGCEPYGRMFEMQTSI
ncbi:MAG: ABC transporter ATP-binding protein [Pseudomonadota bacterium]